MMKKLYLFSLLMVLLAPWATRAQITEFPYFESFETDAGGWTTFDDDGDYYTWYRSNLADGTPSVDGNYFFYSESYRNNVGAFNPDNWLISPAITLPDEPMDLTWFMRIGDADYPAERIAVYVSTTGNTVSDFGATPLMDTTLLSVHHSWTDFTVSLADYAGETIYIGIRHFGVTDMYWVAVDAISIAEPTTCTKPTDIEVSDITTTSATLSFEVSDAAQSTLVKLNGEEYETLTGTSLSFSDLTPATRYNVELITTCSDNSQSMVATTFFYTECEPSISTFPFNDSFEQGTLLCYDTVGDVYIISGSEYSYIGDYSCYLAINSATTIAPTLVTPVFDIPSNAEGYVFECYVAPYNAYNATSNSYAIYAVVDDEYTQIYTGTSNGTNSVYEKVSVNIDNYAGQSVRFAIRHTATSTYTYYAYIFIDDIAVRPTDAPIVSISGPTSVDLGTAAIFAAVLEEGSSAGLSYEWSSQRATAGDATIETNDNADTATITYTDGTTDVITLVATNDFGSYTATFNVHLRNCSPITTLPWAPTISSEQDIECWTIVDANNDGVEWEYSSNYQAMYKSYTSDNDDYLITPAIEMPDDATNVVLSWEDYLSTYYNTEGHYLVRVSQNGSTNIADFTDTLFEITGSNNAYVARIVSLAAYSGQTIRIAFHHSNDADDNGLRLRNFEVRNSIMPRFEIVAAASIDINTEAPIAALITEGSMDGITYLWHSTMADNGQAVIAGTSDSATTITYTSMGIDTLSLTVSNSYGSDSHQVVIRVRDINPVTTLPYSAGFETTDDDYLYWQFENRSGAVNLWTIGSAVNNGGEQSLYISNDNGTTNSYNNGTTSYAYAYRAITFSQAGEYTISYDWRANGETGYDYLRVFVAPGGVDLTSLTPSYGSLPANLIVADNGDRLNRESTWQNHNSTFQINTPGIYLLVFYWRNDSSQGDDPAGAIDNVTVAPLTCSRPTAMNATNITNESISFEWTPAGEEAAWEVTVGNNAPEVVTTTSYTAYNLNANTAYTIKVRSICGDGDTSFALSSTFRTECGTKALPYTYDCEDLVSSQTPDCYTNLGSGYMTYTSSYYHGGTKAIEFYPNGQSGSNILVLPIFEQPTNLLKLDMWHRPEGSSYSGSFSVGYITDLSDTGSFVPVATYQASTGETYAEATITFEDAPEDARIAMRHMPNYTNYYWFVDDITVSLNDGSEPITCARPTNLRTTSVTENSATLDWNSDASEWAISVNNGAEQTVTAHPYTIEDLNANTQYTVRVKALCDDNTESTWTSVSFTTSATEGIDAADAAMVRLYPNPAATSVNLEFEGTATINVVDMNGREVLTTEADSRATLDVSNLAKGAYFVRVTNTTGTAVRKLVVK